MPGIEEPSYWDVVEPVWDSVNIHRGPELFLEQFAKLPLPIGDLLAAHWLLSEVDNGAFPQFFSNSTGVLAPEAAVALDRIGLPDAAGILRRAMAYFGDPYPRKRSVRQEIIDCVWEQPRTPAAEDLLTEMLQLSIEFSQAIGDEDGPFETAADAYALQAQAAN
jgi:hypothetical protein